MLETSQPWNLFGFDLRRVVHYVQAGWNDFLWGERSPVLAAVDEIVVAHQADGETRYYRSGKPVTAPSDLVSAEVNSQAHAIILPEGLVLSKSLRVPVAAEAELAGVVALEVSSSSPFAAADTSYGWSISERTTNNLELQLVISSQGAIRAHIAEHFDDHDVKAFEVWAQAEDRIVVLSGFGEALRQSRNRSRMARMMVIAAFCLLALVLVFAIAAASKKLELQRVQAVQEEVQYSAGEALALREELVASKELIAAARELVASYPPPHGELQRLTSSLGSDTWLTMADIKGARVKIEGESGNAAAVMQQLLDLPAYSRVEAPVAFKIVRSGMERFVLNLTRAPSGGAQ